MCVLAVIINAHLAYSLHCHLSVFRGICTLHAFSQLHLASKTSHSRVQTTFFHKGARCSMFQPLVLGRAVLDIQVCGWV